jgi:hypothetical protein
MFCSTLQLKRPSARVFALTALFIGLFVAAGELVARQLLFQEIMPVPSLGDSIYKWNDNGIGWKCSPDRVW